MDMTAKTAIAVDDDSWRDMTSERGTFSAEKLFRLDGRSVGIDTSREMSLSDMINTSNIEEGLDCEATQSESEDKQEEVCAEESSFVDMNALMAAESLENKKIIYSLVAEDMDTAITYQSDYEENTAKTYSDGEEEQPRSYVAGANKPSEFKTSIVFF